VTATRSTHHDVVVGSRCAGAATALLLSRAGHDVALVDRAAQPSDTLSTHGIARGGVVQLSPDALTGYERARATALRETFDLTRALTAFPPPDRFNALQIQLGEALEREALMLASLPEPPGARQAATAA
jgi:glycine/D-amino acid oxidase-like deaminating enzyme